MIAKKEPSWLKGVLNRGEQTQTYHFETGEKTKVQQRDLNVLAQRVAKANAEVEVIETLLVEAQNHIVTLEGDKIKAVMASEAANKEFWEMAREAMGVKE